MRAIQFILLSTLVTSISCGWLARLNTVKMSSGTNPAYRSLPATTEVVIAPLLDCSSTRVVAPAKNLRRWLDRNLFPELWRRLGATHAPVTGRKLSSKACEYLYASDFKIEQNDNEDLRNIAAQGLAGHTQDNLLIVLYSRLYFCEEQQSTIRDKNGVSVGSVGTGKSYCTESPKFNIAGYMFNRKGDMIYSTGGAVEYARYWEAKDVNRVVAKFLKKLPSVVFIDSASTGEVHTASDDTSR